ncbi:hypothetical protein [Desulfovibrio litoralis]|uniref:Uncharacterized protein n=1 Tax=Desulfovibrio litoralis DSM 11393 TaxID=1121455 RepID=A0A1M7RRF8_9BACT|nr:hypothetical protein [Desulfovibrio litoralis]SHN48771.1 hypothetical protein SAMN02745728_00044 [Desulfovibrio litoralis DSM 11393]
MPTIITNANLLHEAQAYVLEKVKETPYKESTALEQNRKLMQFIDEACVRFNLGPKDAEAMLRLFSVESEKK